MRLVGWGVGAEGCTPSLFDAPGKEVEPLRVMRCACRRSPHPSVPWPGPIWSTGSEGPLNILALGLASSSGKGGREG